MRLYLSSYGLGNQPEAMLPLIQGDGRTAVVMNAQDAVAPENRAERLQRELTQLGGLGLQPEELDLRDYFDDQPALQQKVVDYDYFWVRGGNVFLLRQAYARSGFDAIITDLLQRDAAAYGGFSAGVCVLGPTLKGLELVDPTNLKSSGYSQQIVWNGLEILDYVIAPHYKSDHPESADIDHYVEYCAKHAMMCKPVQDGQVIVVNGEHQTFLD